MKKIFEVITSFTDENNYTHIDAYFNNDMTSEGETIAIFCNDTKKVFFIENMYRNNKKVKDAINQLLSKD